MRTRLYHHTAPKGELFTDQEAHDKAVKAGWQPAPWLIKGFGGEEKPIIKEEDLPEMLPSELPEGKLCACGCGTPTKGTWAPGHYQKHQKETKTSFAWPLKGKENGDKKDDKPAGPKHSE